MLKTSPIGVVLGSGSIGSRHHRVLLQSRRGPIAIVPLRPERRVELAQAGYIVYDSLESAARMGARFAVIATDSGRHVGDALNALSLGCDLLVEKPLAQNADQAGQVIRKAAQHERLVLVGCLLRFSDSLAVFRQILPEIGPVHYVRIEAQSFLPDWRPARVYRESYSAKANQGGVLLDLIHEIDYAGWIFGWPKAVQASLRNTGRLGIETEETSDLLWTAPSGTLVSIRLDYLSRPPLRCMRAFGEHGILEWDGISGTCTLSAVGENGRSFRAAQTNDDMLEAQDLAFLDACSGNLDQRFASGEDGVRALAVCDAARVSSNSRREEPVTYV